MATNTYVALSTQTVGTAVASVTFSSIPQGYTDLVLVANFATSTAGPLSYQVGTGSVDTTSSYSRTCLYGDGSSAASFRESNQTYFNTANSSTTLIANDIVHFMNYSNATTYKTILDRNNNSSGTVQANVYLWRKTTAIDTIKIFNANGYNLITGSTFTLYGIAIDSAPNAAKATGGTITYDQFNVIHTFTSSGTFTPTEGLVADYLVIAGGGAGGNGNGGAAGGGAGGYLTSVGPSGGGGAQGSPLSLASGTAYTVTVGAGGTGGSGSTGVGTNGSNSTLSTITAIGGGVGGSYGLTQAGSSGGSGGGSIGVGGTVAGGAGTAGQGYAGGSGTTNEATYRSAGGGGGAGAVGVNGPANNSSGAGGAGLASTITGTSVTRAGGGGGSQGTPSAGGTGGGGAGGATGTAGTANTGSGGGGGTWGGSGGGAGGSGVVIIRYPK